MVSSCCGSEYEYNEETSTSFDERYICNECGEGCETIEDYEYEAIQKENYEEERADAKRKYNE